ncbi:hypothetical protein CPB84DRAFT_1784326 [Gymnopilus junonius]|uniref:Uncharacterized protein n=1 Tax=Gymnopilus junonius TaxID=109634 RepID=A0A9P5NH23_GYMJU|nr:hypothetical protein CPB84DRAFT_1784326 [Gymnopilus junonius]
MAASTQQGPFGGAGAGAATANVGISQGSKDSWESVYAPKSSTGDAPTSASHRPQNGSHPSSPRSNSNSQVLLSSHLHPRHVLTPSSSNPFAHVDYARTPSILNVLAHGRGHGHLSAQAQVQAHIRTPSSSNPFKYAYNSQFESNVAKEVEKVNKLLESEIRVDYDGWLRDPDEGEGDESKGWRRVLD